MYLFKRGPVKKCNEFISNIKRNMKLGRALTIDGYSKTRTEYTKFALSLLKEE